MAADDSGLYVLSETAPLSAWRPGDAQLTPLAAGAAGDAVGPLLDDQFVYWTTGGGKLMKTSKQ
jgi:hypothetical protein